jgi:hypothetical protein
LQEEKFFKFSKIIRDLRPKKYGKNWQKILENNSVEQKKIDN